MTNGKYSLKLINIHCKIFIHFFKNVETSSASGGLSPLPPAPPTLRPHLQALPRCTSLPPDKIPEGANVMVLENKPIFQKIAHCFRSKSPFFLRNISNLKKFLANPEICRDFIFNKLIASNYMELA